MTLFVRAICLLFLMAAASLPGTVCGAVELIGYVPYYRMSDQNYVNNILKDQLGMLDEVRYFGVTVTAAGGLTTTTADLANIATIKAKIAELPANRRPRLDITLGGDSTSGGFAAVAADAGLRTLAAQNIRDLLIQTEAVGVDVDWEHPAEGVQLTTHYPALLAAIKEQAGADRRVYATVSPEKILPRSVFTGDNAIDGVSIMTYDIGWWASDPADPNLNQHSLPEYVQDTVNAWTNPVGTPIPRTWVFGTKRSIDAPESMIGVGAPFYGRGYNGSSQNLAVAYRDLASLVSADGNSYLYQGSNVWIPGPQTLASRVAYAQAKGLQHIIIWELWHDLPPADSRSLLRTMFYARAATLGDFNADGLANNVDLAVWTSNIGLQTGANGEDGDADADGDVDGADFLIWQRHSVDASQPVQSIPEPQCLLLGLPCLALGRMR